jgi:hypothetical protein
MKLTRGQWESALYAADIDPLLGPDETEGPYVDMAYTGRYGNSGPFIAIVGAVQFTVIFLIQLALELHSCDDEESTEGIALELARTVQVVSYGSHEVAYFPGLEIG